MLHLSPTHRSLACPIVVFTAFLFLCPLTVGAIPLAEYQQKLKEAITCLSTVVEQDEDESDSDFALRVHEEIEEVRFTLPAQMTVEVDGDVYTIDNSVLHKTLTELDQLPVDEQLEKVGEVIESLRALEARVADRQAAMGSLETKDQAKSRLETILARPEYGTGARGPNALTRLAQDFLRWIQKLFPKRRTVEPGRVDTISLIAQIVVVGLAAAVLIYIGTIVLRRFGRTRKKKEPKQRGPRIVLGERLEPEATSTDLLSQAELLARNGDLRAAIRKAYIALLVELGDRKVISLAQHKTNRDYLNSVRNVPPLHATMRGLTDSFERHWYGFENVTPNDWQDFRAGYLAALQAER